MVDASEPAQPIPAPQSWTTPARTPGGFKELGTTTLACQLEVAEDSLYGHWCRRCEGIWWGLPLEASCPACGHRGV